jgi:hypothetical protein
MPPYVERSAFGLVARGILAALLLLAAIPAYLAFAPSWRAAAVRVACAVIVITGCARVIRGVRGSIEGHAPSALDAPPPMSPAPELDERFLRLRDDLVFSTRSRRYFDVILWPRLVELAGGTLPRPAERRGIRRRGPALKTLESLIAEVEKRP